MEFLMGRLLSNNILNLGLGERATMLISILIASFGAWQSLSVVLNDGEWPSGYQAWDYLDGLESNGVLLAHDYWWAAGFFTDNFVEYLSTDTMSDFDAIIRYNAQYIMVRDDTPYLTETDIFRKVATFGELNCSLYEVNWTMLREISPFLPFELHVDKKDGTGALWFFLASTEFSRIPSDGVYRGFIMDNTTLGIELHGICYNPDTIYLTAINRVVYQCDGMWTGCRPADSIRINITGRPCIYHPDFVLDRF